ncbi:2,3-diaminopropionate biosynthesis protein SbnB [Aquimarina sp. M1]
MKYLSSNDINSIPLDWESVISEIYKATSILKKGNFSQPIKPYLRYNNLENRIIAMPAHIGDDIGVAGIKWISSFPGNINKKLKRAHSTIILNEEDTGIPFAILNTAIVSGIRTSAVTGAVIKKYLELKKIQPDQKLIVGITGFGPIGQLHLKMIDSILGDKVEEYLIYDVRPGIEENLDSNFSDKVSFVHDWESVFDVSDIFCTCTVSKSPYIDKKPKKGSLHLNVSLRDYKTQFMDYADIILVDDWEEVCREKTDVEMMHLERGLKEEDTFNLSHFLFDSKEINNESVVMFNPMGMAVYDLAVSKYFYDKANELGIGVELQD